MNENAREHQRPGSHLKWIAFLAIFLKDQTGGWVGPHTSSLTVGVNGQTQSSEFGPIRKWRQNLMESKTFFIVPSTNSCNIDGASIYLVPLFLVSSLNLGLGRFVKASCSHHFHWCLKGPFLPKVWPGDAWTPPVTRDSLPPGAACFISEQLSHFPFFFLKLNQNESPAAVTHSGWFIPEG